MTAAIRQARVNPFPCLLASKRPVFPMSCIFSHLEDQPPSWYTGLRVFPTVWTLTSFKSVSCKPGSEDEKIARVPNCSKLFHPSGPASIVKKMRHELPAGGPLLPSSFAENPTAARRRRRSPGGTLPPPGPSGFHATQNFASRRSRAVRCVRTPPGIPV